MWIQRLTIRGRRTDNGIGHYPAMGLAEARAAAFERWKIAKAGGDPRKAGSRPAAPTFAEAAEAVIAIHEPSWRGPKSGPQWRASLRYLRLSEPRRAPGVGDHAGPRHGRPRAHLERQARDGAPREAAHLGHLPVGGGPRPPHGRSGGYRDRGGAAAQRSEAAAYARAPVRGSGEVYREGAGQRTGERVVEAGARVPGAHRGPLGRSAQGDVGRVRSRRRDVDGAGRAHEGEPRAPRPAVEARAGSARGGGGLERRVRTGVPGTCARAAR